MPDKPQEAYKTALRAAENTGFHARDAKESPMLLSHALPNHGGSYG